LSGGGCVEGVNMSTVGGNPFQPSQTLQGDIDKFKGSLDPDKQAKAKQVGGDWGAFKNLLSPDQQKAQADFEKEKNPFKKLKMMHDFEKNLTPDEKKALKTFQDDKKSFDGSLSKDQKKAEEDMMKQLNKDGSGSFGDVLNLSG
jgi:hypothetical protein